VAGKRKPAMSAGGLAGVFPVLVVGALLYSMPAVTRPTVQFGVRVPRERAGTPVIRRERRAYYWRTAAIGVCCTLVAVATMRYGSWWLSKIILLLELAAGLSCFWVARRKIAAVKNADGWFAGLRQTVVTDTSWRTDPPRFPVRWLVPALAVMAATAAIGALRYPGLPAHVVNASGHRVSKAAVSVLIVAGQLYFTAVYSGLMLIVYRSRPDVDAADPAASMLRYRRFLAAFSRALLTMAALACALVGQSAHCLDMDLAMAGDDSDRTRDVASVEVTREQVSHARVSRFGEKPPLVTLSSSSSCPQPHAMVPRTPPMPSDMAIVP
jgi:uncharacterized membrane protein